MGNIRRGRSERQHVDRITEEWVENNCINVTKRDMQILQVLSQFGLLNSEQIHTLVKGEGIQKPFYELSQGQKRCNERIRMLYDIHCVNKASPKLAHGEGTSKQYVWLDRAGIKLLGLNRRAKRELPQDYKHQSLIMDVYCELVRGARRGEWENIYLETEVKQETAPVIPDLISIFRLHQKGGLFFIEVDRSEKKESDEKKKIQQYKEWQLSNHWFKERWQQYLPKPIFPKIVYLFDESKPYWKRRANALSRYANQVGLNGIFIGLSTFMSYMESLK